jgi:hypothetical protein
MYRFQILRELLPHNDQKRDKATFLSEVTFFNRFLSCRNHISRVTCPFCLSPLLQVIEYIRFLQEKVQKYKTTFPEWNQENAKILPWVKVLAPKLFTIIMKGIANSWLSGSQHSFTCCSQICIFDHSGKMCRYLCC